MLDKPLVTCCVLTYKNFSRVKNSIASILKQDYPNIELGVFDDGSPNFPRIEIADFISSNKKPNIKNVIIHSNKENKGTVKNINSSIQMTSGDFFILIPSDDEFYDDSSCSRIVNFFLENDADIVTSYREIVDGYGQHLGFSPSYRSAEKLNKADAYEQFKWIAAGAPLAGAGTYYSRRIIKKYNGFDENYVLQEDGPFFLRATRDGTKILFINKKTYKYVVGNGVSSGSENSPILVNDVKRMFENEIIPFLANFNILEKRRVQYELERIKIKKQLSTTEKIRLLLKYPDVICFRHMYSH